MTQFLWDSLPLLVFCIVPLLALATGLVLIITGKGGRRFAPVVLAAVVAFYLLVFVVIFFPSHMGQESARRTACLNNLRQIGLAMIVYANDSGDAYPCAIVDDSEPAQRRLARLLKSGDLIAPKIFHCPSANYQTSPKRERLEDWDLTKCVLARLADVYLDNDWCSYGLDPRVKRADPKSRALLADRPNPQYWGNGVNSPPAGKPGSNSPNHKGEGQNVVYNDGSVQWIPTCKDYFGLDPNIYSTNPEIDPEDDSNIDFGPATHQK